VITAPVIREPILGGSGQISGSFTAESANELALVLRAGALPAPLLVLEERTVGPGLGADSIRAGVIACIIGLVLVIAYMLVLYGLFGVFSVLGLCVTLLMMVGILSGLGATLTLPGIAGIVLTMGMSVDANVLIYERMREEARLGRSLIATIDSGYTQASRAIFDSNLTGIISAALLYIFGTGPVKGFAVTLFVGICTSIFTAIMLNRMMIISWMRMRKRTAIPL
jgi:preprotein translocase subunit SecD